MKQAAISIFILLSGCLTLSAQSAARKALLADPRYTQIQQTVDHLRKVEPDGLRKPSAGEALRRVLTELYAVEDLLDRLRQEAEECGHCQPQQGKYEEFEKESAPLREMMHSLGIPDKQTLWKAVEEYLTHRPPTVSEDQADEAERQRVKGGAEGHCHALYDAANRLQALSVAEKQKISKNTKKWFTFAQGWADPLKACLAQVNPEILWAQHRLSLIQCFNAHDYSQLNVSGAPYAKVVAEHKAYDACMNEKDIVTAMCTQDRYVAFWVAQRREPRRPPAPVQPCPAPDLAVTGDPQSTTGTLARVYRSYGSKPETVAYWTKRAAGATPASMGIDVTIPPPTDVRPREGEPVNASGVPVGARLTVATAEPIDLLHTDAAHLYTARLEQPAEYNRKAFLTAGTQVLLRVEREGSDKSFFVNVFLDSIEVNGQKYPVPASGGIGRSIQLMDAFGRRPTTPQVTMIPAQTRMEFTVLAVDLTAARAVPFLTEDKNFSYQHGARANEGARPSPGVPPPPGSPAIAGQRANSAEPAAIPGNLSLSVVAAEPIDLGTADPSRRFRAQTTAPVMYQGTVLIPAGSDVFLKVIRKQETRGFLHVALTADYAIIADRQVPLATTQMMRSVSTGATPRGIPTRPGQLPPPGAPTLPAQTQLNLITVTPQTR